MLFAAWLLGLVIIGRALVGELPIEISGQGLRYADARTAQHGLADSETTFGLLKSEIDALQETVTILEVRQDAHLSVHDDML